MLVQSLLFSLLLPCSGQLISSTALSIDMTVQVLVSQLGAKRYNVRQHAENSLLQLRELSFAAVDKARHSKDPEILPRALRISDEIERRITWQTSVITLKSKSMRASQIYEELARLSNTQISFTLRGGPEHDPILSVDFDKAPLWQALASVVEKAGHTLSASSIVTTGPAYTPLVFGQVRDKTRVSCVEGACGIVPAMPPMAYRGNGDQSETPQTLRIPLVVVLDRLAASSAIFSPLVRCRAWSSDGTYLEQYRAPLIEPPTRVDFLNPNYAATTTLYELNPQIFVPIEGSKKIARLEVDVTVYAITRLKTFEINDLAKAVTKSFEGNSFTLSPPRDNARGGHIVSLVTEGSEAFLAQSPSLEMIDPGGTRFSLHATGPMQLDASKVEHIFIMKIWPSDTVSQARISFPAKIASKEFKFKFTNLDLPEALWQNK